MTIVKFKGVVIITSLESAFIINETKAKKMVRKNIVILLLGQAVSMFGTDIYNFVISLYILKVTGSGLNFALTMVLSTLPRVIFAPIAGVLADRFDRKRMVVWLDILSGVVVLILFILSSVDELRLGYIYITTILLSICNTLFSIPLSVSIPNLVDDENITRVNSLNYSIKSVASISGPFIGGLTFAFLDIRLFLGINAMSFILSGISEKFIDFKVREKIYGIAVKAKGTTKSFKTDLKEGWSYMKENKWLLILSRDMILTNLFVTIGVSIPLPYISKVVFKFSDAYYGMVTSAFPVGVLVASLIISMLPKTRKLYKSLLVGRAGLAIGMLLIGIIGSQKFFVLDNIYYLIMFTIIAAGLSISGVSMNIPTAVTFQKRIPNDKLGRVQGSIAPFSVISMPVGAIIAGALIDKIPPYTLPLISSVLMLVAMVSFACSKEFKDM